MKIKKKTLTVSAAALILATAPFWRVSATPLAVWTAVDWAAVDEAIDAASQGRAADRKENENINVVTGGIMEVPAETLRKLAGRNVTLAVHTGDGIAVSASGRELKTAYQDLVINMVDEEDLIPNYVSQGILSEALYSRTFAMAEKKAYDVLLNIHFQLGREYAGKYANLYYFDELTDKMVCQNSYIITDTGMAMFSMTHGDEYLLTVTEKLPAGGRLSYTVKEGDCLSRIAVRNGVSVRELMAANAWIKDADKIRIGDVVAVVKNEDFR